MKTRIFVVLAALILTAPLASADTMNIFGVGDHAAWNGWSAAGGAGATFWDRSSYDGQDCNIGYWLSASGGCTHPSFKPFYSPGSTPDFLGKGQTPFSFTGNTEVSVTMQIQVAGLASQSSFGWFDAEGKLHELFYGLNRGNTATFVPNGEYGFYIKTPDNTLLSNNLYTGIDGKSHAQFAAFRFSDSHYMLGIEDWVSNKDMAADYDYQDMSVELNFSTIPEPATMILLGSGLFGVAAAARRRRR